MPTTSRSRATQATSSLLSASATAVAPSTASSAKENKLPRVNPARRLSQSTEQPYEVQNTEEDEFPNIRNPKRRKLEIRGPRQQTLDGFFDKEAPLKPPVKIATYAPSGPLIETINGVQSHIDTASASHTTNGTAEHDDDVQAPAAKKQRKSRSLEPKQEDKRALRSQDDGPRLKSDLATYFSNYEDIIFDTPHEPELLSVDAVVYITDDKPAVVKARSLSPSKSAKSPGSAPISVRNNAQASSLSNVRTIDLSSLSKGLAEPIEDPLTDETFRISHRRAERKEKQMRNIEREHAMHEKAQLDRLLDGLLGHDWLRVLGITGVTEGEAKKYEPKRQYFIHEVRALVAKFKEWRDEERRQRLEKEAALAAEREAELADDEDEEDGTATEVSSSNPPSSDLNASASRQLQLETASAMRLLAAKAKNKDWSQTPMPPAPIPYRPPSPITSFYSARHLRDSALKRARNSRNQLAFGHLLPDLEVEDFKLPEDYLTEDVLRASARERRRRKRENIANPEPSQT